MKILLTVSTIFLFCSNSSAQFPSSYDLRTYGYVSSVKDQSTCGACWAFATIASIESTWLKQGGTSIDLSEDNLNDCHLFNELPCTGGSFYMAQATLSMHPGIYTETQDPFTPSTTDCPTNLTFPPTPAAYIEEIRFIPASVNDIKQALMDYGAVATTMFMNYNDAAVWDGVNYKYYDNNISSSDSAYAHSVTIVGWDDSYTFSSAPGNGGWIIKDSYGTSWANSGYFYCSYYDAGILSENAVFPSIKTVPNPTNRSIVYAYDELGWVDNYGFSSTQGYTLAKYTLLPYQGFIVPQKIKRIGTYAVDDNMTIDIEIYRSFQSGTLSDLIVQATISCPYKGFYTHDFELDADTVQSEIFVKVKYTSNNGFLNPIPIETSEAGHTTNNFSASTSLCWMSQNGTTWTQTGSGTSYNFDPCIKMYTEQSVIAKIGADLEQQACVGDMVNLTDQSITMKDSSVWIIDGVSNWNMPTMQYQLANPGITNISLIVYFGEHTDTAFYPITVGNHPDLTVTQNWNTLNAFQTAANYQWLDCDNNFAIIPGETGQSYTPTLDGNYAVEINLNGCIDTTLCNNLIISIEENEFSSEISVFPNPTRDFVEITLTKSYNFLQIRVLNELGEEIEILEVSETDYFQLDLPENSGVYFIEILNERKEKAVLKVVKE